MTPGEATREGGRTDQSPLAHEAVLRLSSLIHSMRMYPSGHPRVDAASDACVEVLEKLFSRRSSLLLLVHFDKLLCEDGVLSESDPIAESFVPELRKRRIRMILIRSGVSSADITGLAEVIALKAEELESLGGPRQALIDADVNSVELLEFRYSMDGREVGSEIKDPSKAVDSAHRLLAYGVAFEKLLKNADLPPADVPVLRRALTDQSVLERSLALDGSLASNGLLDHLPGLSVPVAQALVTLMKQSKVPFGQVGHRALGNTVKWVLDAATETTCPARREETGEPGAAKMKAATHKLFSSQENFVEFLRAQADSSRNVNPATADLLKWIFAHMPSVKGRALEPPKRTELRGAPEHSPVHTVLQKLGDMGEEAGTKETAVENADISRAAAAAMWHLLTREEDREASRKLGARLARAIQGLGAPDRSKFIWRLLKTAATGEADGVPATAAAGCREGLERFDAGELVDSVVNSAAEDSEKNDVIRVFVSARPEAVESMMEHYFSTSDSKAKDCILAAIAMVPTYAAAALREQLEAHDPTTLQDLAPLLSALRHESAVELLEALSKHRDASVARAGLTALAENGTPEAALALGRHYQTGNKQTRKSIILLLANVDQVASLETLSRIAQMRDLFNRRLDERIMAVQALGRLGNERAEPTLNVVASTRGIFRRRAAARLRHAASRALARLHGDTDTYTVEQRPTRQG